LEIKDSSFSSVGKIFRGEGVKAVRVRKEREPIDPDWFSQLMVDLILLVQGKLKVEFEQTNLESCLLEAGDLIVLPPNTRCRAHHWPREDEQATVFLAVYPVK
jgi:quercetin dioxygenase-like cupin family protein